MSVAAFYVTEWPGNNILFQNKQIYAVSKQAHIHLLCPKASNG